MQSAANHNDTHDASALAWYCIETLIDAMHELSNNTDSGKTRDEGNAPPATDSHLHRLHLTLIATVPSLPLPLMLHVLDRIRDIILEKDLPCAGSDTGNAPRERKAELVDALFREILERVGDGEKEVAMGWWYANLEELKGAV